MPSLIGSLYVSLTADFAPFQRNMQSADSVVATTAGSMRRNMGLTERSVSGLQRTMQSGFKPYALISAARTFDTVQQRANLLRGALFATTAAFGGLGAALTTNVVSRYLDSFTGLQNQMRAVSDTSADLAANMAGVQAVSERSRSSLAAVATLYSRLARSSPQESPTNILRRVETINKALQLGGATAQEAASAAIQFSQAIQSNRLGGDELRAVLETPLGNELAKGMGITIGKLREMSKQGKLTSDVLYKALDRISGSVDQKFAGSIATIDQALTVVDGKIIAYAGSLNDAYGITKLITSSIYAFGNNLSTIIPLLAQVGFGLGTLYAARRGAGVAGFLGTPIKAFSAMRQARLDDVRNAKEEVEIAKRFADAQAMAAAKARNVAGGDVSALAPKGVTKTYLRDLNAVQKADADHLALLEKKAVVTTQLGEVYKTTTVKELKAAQALAEAEDRVNQARAHRGAVGLLRNQADKQVFSLFGGTDTAAIAKTKSAITAIEKEEIAAASRVQKAEQALETARADSIRHNGAAFTAAAEQRAAILVQEKQLTADIVASEEHRSRLATNLGASRAAVQTAGGDVAGKALREAETASRGAAAGYERASSGLATMQRAAGFTSVALSGLSIASRSLYAFLGGPWGVAIIGASILLEVFGRRAAEAAAKTANAQKAISEALSDISQEDISKRTPDQALALIDAKIGATKDQLQHATDGLVQAREEIAAQISGQIFDNISGDNMQALEMQFSNLTNEFLDGKISLEKFRFELIKIGANPQILDELIGQAGDAKTEFYKATIAVDYFVQKLKELVGIRAGAAVAVGGFVDPIIETRRRLREEANKAEADQRRKYGAGQEAGREEVERQRKIKALLDAAGDTGDKALNTPAKIAAESQRLLEEGYAKTREEAEKLARQELDLAEKTRLANKSATSGAKDYENFAHKIAELRAEASGAFLSDLDQKVLDTAKSLKDGSAMMKQYVDAINSGDMTKAPAELLQVRDALMQMGAASTWRDILQNYGNAAQLAGTFADKQAELNFLLANGRITADQATLAYTDFITSFGNFEWINKTSSAITNFASSAIEDFDNIGDAFKGLLKDLLKIAEEELVTKPLERNLRNFFSAIVGGGQMAGAAPSGFNLLGAFFGNKGANASTIATAGKTVGGTIATAIASGGAGASATVLAASARAIKGLESGGNYRALGPVQKNGSRALGAYQVMSNNLPSWSKEVFGRVMSQQEFLGDPGAQDSIFNHFFGKSISKYGNASDAAAIWHSGSTLEAAKARGAHDSLGTTTVSYVEKFNAALGKTTETVVDMGAKTGSVAKTISNLIGSNGFDYSKLLSQNGFKPTANGFAQMLGIGGGTGTGGGGGGFFTSLLSGIGSIFSLFFHGGGKVGAGGVGRMMPAGAFAGAPRLHSGLKSDEFSAILQRGERVLTARDEAKTMGIISGLSRRVGKGGGGKTMQIANHFHLDGAITKKDVVDMVHGGINQAVETSKRSWPEWQHEYGTNGAVA